MIMLQWEFDSTKSQPYLLLFTGVRRGALAPRTAKNSMFLFFFEYLFRFFVCFCPPPWKILPSHGKKFADDHVIIARKSLGKFNCHLLSNKGDCLSSRRLPSASRPLTVGLCDVVRRTFEDSVLPSLSRHS
jgi:hypothetical protein